MPLASGTPDDVVSAGTGGDSVTGTRSPADGFRDRFGPNPITDRFDTRRKPSAAEDTDPSAAEDTDQGWLWFTCTGKDGATTKVYYTGLMDAGQYMDEGLQASPLYGQLKVIEVAADGSCLYNALALGAQCKQDGKCLRQCLAAWAVSQHDDDPVMTISGLRLTDLPGLAGAKDWDTWMVNLQKNEFGSSAELMLASNALNMTICVFSAAAKRGDQPTWFLPEEKFKDGNGPIVYVVNHWSLDGTNAASRHYDLLVPTAEKVLNACCECVYKMRAVNACLKCVL